MAMMTKQIRFVSEERPTYKAKELIEYLKYDPKVHDELCFSPKKRNTSAALPLLSTLEELTCDETLSQEEAVELVQTLTAAKKILQLTTLRLTRCDLRVETARALSKLMSCNETIQTLDLSHNSLGSPPDGIKALLLPLSSSASSSSLSSLEKKAFSCLDSQQDEQKPRHCGVESLVLENNKIGPSAASSIASFLCLSSSIMDEGAGASCSFAPFLQELNLGYNSLGPRGIKALAPHIAQSHSLKRLFLGHANLKPSGIRALATELRNAAAASSSPCSGLQMLDLTGNKVGALGMSHLYEWLVNDRSLTSLSLACNDLGPDGACIMGSILKFNSTLTELRLGSNAMGDEGIEALGQGLELNSSITRLYLDWNQMTDKGAEIIAMGLKSGASLRHLDLRGNHIGLEGCQALAHCLPFHVGLQCLDMGRNKLCPKALRAFATAMTKCGSSFMRLDWDENPLVFQQDQDDDNQENMPNAVVMMERVVQYRKNLSQWLTPLITRILSRQLTKLNLMTRASCMGDLEWIKLATALQQSVLLTRRSCSDLIASSTNTGNNKGDKHISCLYAGGQHMTCTGLVALCDKWISQSKYLMRVFLHGVTHIDVKGWNSLGHAIREHESIQVLSLTYCGMTSKHIKVLLEGGLQHNATLERITLSNNNMQDEGLGLLASALAARHANLMNSCSEIDLTVEDDYGNGEIAEMDDDVCLFSLESLDVSFNHIAGRRGNLRSNMWKHLCQAGVAEFHCCGNLLTDDSVLELAKVLRNEQDTTTKQEGLLIEDGQDLNFALIDLSDNCITDAGEAALLSVLPVHETGLFV